MSLKFNVVSPELYKVASKRDASFLDTNVRRETKMRRTNTYSTKKFQINTQNRFDVLSDHSDFEDEEDIIRRHLQRSQNKNTEGGTSNSSQAPANTSLKIPPIVVYSYFENHSETIKQIKSCLKNEIDIKFKGNRILIFPKSSEDHKIICELLKSNDIEFHSYTLPADKVLRLVLKNVSPNVSTDEITEDLERQNIKVSQVKQMFKYNEDRTNKILFPLFIVSFGKEVTLNEVLKIRKVCEYLISWEKYRNGSGITQCYRCQSFGHTAQNCNKKPKCVLCSGPHKSEECKVVNVTHHKCCNCGENHRASDKQCAEYLKRLQFKSVQPSKPNLSPNFNMNLHNFPNLSPNSVYKQDSRPPIWVQRNNSINNDSAPLNSENGSFLSELKNIFNMFNISKIMLTIKTLGVKLRSQSDPFSKIMILIECITDLLNCDGK